MSGSHVPVKSWVYNNRSPTIKSPRPLRAALDRECFLIADKHTDTLDCKLDMAGGRTDRRYQIYYLTRFAVDNTHIWIVGILWDSDHGKKNYLEHWWQSHGILSWKFRGNPVVHHLISTKLNCAPPKCTSVQNYSVNFDLHVRCLYQNILCVHALVRHLSMSRAKMTPTHQS